MIRRPPRSTPLYSSAASDVYKRQVSTYASRRERADTPAVRLPECSVLRFAGHQMVNRKRLPYAKNLTAFIPIFLLRAAFTFSLAVFFSLVAFVVFVFVVVVAVGIVWVVRVLFVVVFMFLLRILLLKQFFNFLLLCERLKGSATHSMR